MVSTLRTISTAPPGTRRFLRPDAGRADIEGQGSEIYHQLKHLNRAGSLIGARGRLETALEGTGAGLAFPGRSFVYHLKRPDARLLTRVPADRPEGTGAAAPPIPAGHG